MTKQVKILSGFFPDDKRLSWSIAEIVAEVGTGGEDCNGFKGLETLGIAKNEYGGCCLFVGSKDLTLIDKRTAIFLNEDGRDISTLLHELAEEYRT